MSNYKLFLKPLVSFKGFFPFSDDIENVMQFKIYFIEIFNIGFNNNILLSFRGYLVLKNVLTSCKNCHLMYIVSIAFLSDKIPILFVKHRLLWLKKCLKNIYMRKINGNK